MKTESIIKIYKIDTFNTTVAEIQEAIPNVEMMDSEEAAKNIKSFVIANEMSLMDEEAVNAELLKHARCRICNVPGELITLMRNRPAYFCKTHNITNPIPIELVKRLEFDYEPTK